MARRDPLNGKLVTLIGGTGFICCYLAQELLARGARLRIASRQPKQAHDLKPLANLGQLQLVQCDVNHPASLRAAVAGADAVVNLVGTFSGNLEAVMGRGAGAVARAAAEAGASALVQLSAIGADPASAARYGRAKAAGEAAVLAAFPAATVLRPSIVFGEDAGFIPLLAGMVAALPVLPVFAPEAELQLVFVDDVAAVVVAALADPASHGGRTYELGGPERIGNLALHRRIAGAQHRQRHFIAMPDAASALFAAIPGTPMGRDQ